MRFKPMLQPIHKILLLGGGLALLGGGTLVAQAQQDCDASYPTVCILPPPPDLDCGDIPHRRFEVRQPDPHRFDGDFDGIGCEK